MACSSDHLARQRANRKRTGNAATKKYERTKKGKLMRTYRNMLSRVSGILRHKAHLYGDLPILERDDFYQWAMAQEAFHRLFDEWVASGYCCGDSPSIDRIDSTIGYVPGNMQWLSHRENSAKISRRSSRAIPRPDPCQT